MEKPALKGTTGVLVIFPEERKRIAKIGGIFKGHTIDYAAVEKELGKLSGASGKHILQKASN